MDPEGRTVRLTHRVIRDLVESARWHLEVRLTAIKWPSKLDIGLSRRRIESKSSRACHHTHIHSLLTVVYVIYVYMCMLALLRVWLLPRNPPEKVFLVFICGHCLFWPRIPRVGFVLTLVYLGQSSVDLCTLHRRIEYSHIFGKRKTCWFFGFVFGGYKRTRETWP